MGVEGREVWWRRKAEEGGRVLWMVDQEGEGTRGEEGWYQRAEAPAARGVPHHAEQGQACRQPSIFFLREKKEKKAPSSVHRCCE